MKTELLSKTLKKDLSENDLSTRLSKILGYDVTDYGLRTTFNASTLEDLLNIEYNELLRAERLGKLRELEGIRKKVHLYGCTLKGEYKELNLTEEEILIPISALEISKRVLAVIYRTGYINVFGDLLSTPYHKIEQIKGMGEKYLEELTNYLESIGYNIKITEPSIEIIKKELSESGEVLIEEVIPSRKIMLALNRRGIYTLDQLLERELTAIPGVGKVYQQEIASGLKKYTKQDETLGETNQELVELSKVRDELRKRNIELRLEQLEVTEKLRKIEAEIRNKKAGIQYGKK